MFFVPGHYLERLLPKYDFAKLLSDYQDKDIRLSKLQNSKFLDNQAIKVIFNSATSSLISYVKEFGQAVKKEGLLFAVPEWAVFLANQERQYQVAKELLEVYKEVENKNPVEIAQNAIKHAKTTNHNVVIVDTAGRLAIDEQMMNEIAAVKSAINPNEILFVVDSMTGQDAVNTAKAFNEKLNFDGVVLTKLDGDTRGGAALTIRSVVDKPIKFIGTSEKMDGLDVFHPDRMASRILGMGDVISLVERAQQQFDEAEARKMQKKIAKNQFGFDDFLKQIQQIKKMGNMKDLMGMIPGMGKALKGVDIDDDAFKGIEAMIKSMTLEERSNPKILNGSRR